MNLDIKISKKPEDYPSSIAFMEERILGILEKKNNNLLWILQYPNIYTAGTSAKNQDLIDKNKYPTFNTNRGGQWTYHGDGQKIVYFVYELKERNIKQYVRKIEETIIEILKEYGITSNADPKNIGIWVKQKNEINKIAAIGIRVKKWIAYHGFSLNIKVNKKNYEGIVPCGISDKGIANITDFINENKLNNLDDIIIDKFKNKFSL
jgi:lipoyl(octanoyl) transferase